MDLTVIKEKIEKKDYESHLESAFFGGAGAVLSEEYDERREKDVRDNYYWTPNAKYYVWLIKELKETVQPDYLEKLEFYPRLIDFIRESDSKFDDICKAMTSVVEMVEKFF